MAVVWECAASAPTDVDTRCIPVNWACAPSMTAPRAVFKYDSVTRHGELKSPSSGTHFQAWRAFRQPGYVRLPQITHVKIHHRKIATCHP